MDGFGRMEMDGYEDWYLGEEQGGVDLDGRYFSGRWAVWLWIKDLSIFMLSTLVFMERYFKWNW